MAHHCTPMMADTPRESLLLQELATLREINQAQQAQIAALTARIEQITQDNVVLRLKVDAMARKLFGRSSEPERSGDRQPQAARRAQAKPESKARPCTAPDGV